MRPRLTASSTTSSMRSRVSITRLSGRMTPRVIASRSSAADLPEKSSREAVLPAAAPVCRARFWAVCWRPRARPPADAARRCDALLRVDPERVEPERDELEREDVDLRLDE